MKIDNIDDSNIRIDIPLHDPRPSSTGKSDIRFTTGGYMPLGNGMKIMINVIETKIKKSKKSDDSSSVESSSKS